MSVCVCVQGYAHECRCQQMPDVSNLLELDLQTAGMGVQADEALQKGSKRSLQPLL